MKEMRSAMPGKDTPARQFFTGGLWGGQQKQPETTGAAGSAGLSGAAGTSGLMAPPPRWTRVSSGSRSAESLQTPSPRRISAKADEAELTPPKPSLLKGDLPQLLRASTGPDPDERDTEIDSSTVPPTAASSRVLSASLPAWATAPPEAVADPRPVSAAEASARGINRLSTVEQLASPRTRLRGKTSIASPGSGAVVSLATPPKFQLADGPASSLGDLLGKYAAGDIAWMPPVKRPRRSRWMAEKRGTALMEVPIDALNTAISTPETSTDADGQKQHSKKRVRIPTLEFWRNERPIYERLPGSKCPSICRIQLNFAPRMEDMDVRKLPAETVLKATPVITDGQELEFMSVNTGSLESKLIVLPPFRGVANPPTYVVPPRTTGHVYVLEGSLRFAYEDEDGDQAHLQAGDHLMLPSDERETLLASGGLRGASQGVKFKLIVVSVDGRVGAKKALPLGR